MEGHAGFQERRAGPVPTAGAGPGSEEKCAWQLMEAGG